MCFRNVDKKEGRSQNVTGLRNEMLQKHGKCRLARKKDKRKHQKECAKRRQLWTLFDAENRCFSACRMTDDRLSKKVLLGSVDSVRQKGSKQVSNLYSALTVATSNVATSNALDVLVKRKVKMF